MATFSPGRTIVTRQATIKVDPGLRPGTHVFQLVVAGERGESQPQRRVVTIVRRR